MNDVKISNIDFASRQQGAAASSNSSPSNDGQARTPGAVDVESRESAIRAERAQQLSETAQEGQKNVKEAITRLNDYVQSVQRDLQFQLDDTLGKTVVTVIDRQTSEVVRQIPDEVAVRLAQDLQQDEPLSLFDAKV